MTIDMAKVKALREASATVSKLTEELFVALTERAWAVAKVTRETVVKSGVKYHSFDRSSPGAWAGFAGDLNIGTVEGRVRVSYIERGCRGNADEHLLTMELTDELLGDDFERVVEENLMLRIEGHRVNEASIERASKAREIADLQARLVHLQLEIDK